jgi:hypothetical protein
MKSLVCRCVKRKVFTISLLGLCWLTACRKDKNQTVEPFIQSNIPGLYKDGNYYWDKNDSNGYGFAYDDSAKIKVEYKSGNQVKLQFFSSSPYPLVKSYTLTLTRDSIDFGTSYYKFRQTLDSSKTHFSTIFGQFQVSTIPFSQTILLLWYSDATVTNGQYGPPGVSLSCTNFRRR